MQQIRLPANASSKTLIGISEPAVAPFVVSELQTHTHPTSILLDNEQRDLEFLAREVVFYLRMASMEEDFVVRILPEIPSGDIDKEHIFDLQCDRLAALTELQNLENRFSGNAKRLILLTTPTAIFQPCPRPEFLQSKEIKITRGDEVPFTDFAKRLGEELGYYSEVLCETPGEFAVRGGLIDVYPLNADAPHRIDFFGDEVEQIRLYDPTTQRTLGEVNELTIAGTPENEETDYTADALGFLPTEILWILREASRLTAGHTKWFNHPENFENPHRDFRDVFNRKDAANDNWTSLSEVDENSMFFEESQVRIEHITEPAGNFLTALHTAERHLDEFETLQEHREKLLKELHYWQREKIHVVLVCRTEGDKSKIAELISEIDGIQRFAPDFVTGDIHEGFRIRSKEFGAIFPKFCEKAKQGIAFIGTDDILGRRKSRLGNFKRRLLPQQKQVDQLLDFSELADGDHLVHLQHGVGIFRGLRHLELGNKEEEVISLEFAEETFLHVPLRESHLLSRYVGLSKQSPKLGKPGSGQWEKIRAKAEKAALDYAAELLRFQATREIETGYNFGEDHPWQQEFEQTFPFRETPDQVTAIQAVKEDMQKKRPMDRLVCGDVGFGKTEVAIRAAFRAVTGGKQVAFLAPTTVLAQQHYNTLRERMSGYPVIVEQASRFVPPRKLKATLKALHEGKVDILVGTHRLLGQDILFKDLGLLVIDEEQLFGVKQKERLKQMRAAVDIITLSATPIPRTLYMALAGARDLSTIETAPKSRLPIQTVVKGYSKEIVKQAIGLETSRGGQVFYLHNKVKSIEGVARGLREMFPKLQIAVGHGQMGERELESVMTEFVAGKHDVLVCTTIIESGLDIPNCNTLIIEGADRFGLAQLYQLRGRVGRFNRQAFAYLLLNRDTTLRDQARKRLSSIRQFNQLGAGFRIAMRDLELRGAGNLLGTEQSGHIAGVGFDLYCQLLRQSIASLKGEKTASRIRAGLKLDFVQFGQHQESESGSAQTDFQALKASNLEETHVPPIQAILPESYISEAQLRITFYRRLATAVDTKAVELIDEELKDRFKKYPREVQALILTTRIRCLAEEKKIIRVETQGNRLLLRLPRGSDDEFVRIGKRFPRLTSGQPLPRLREIVQYLKKLKR